MELKSENVTLAPKEEEVKSVNASKQDTKKPAVVDSSLPLIETFRSLTLSQRQRILNYTIDRVIDNKKNQKYVYHGYATEGKKSNYNR